MDKTILILNRIFWIRTIWLQWIVWKNNSFWRLNCVLILNWFVWNRTDYLYNVARRKFRHHFFKTEDQFVPTAILINFQLEKVMRKFRKLWNTIHFFITWKKKTTNKQKNKGNSQGTENWLEVMGKSPGGWTLWSASELQVGDEKSKDVIVLVTVSTSGCLITCKHWITLF